MPCSTRPRPVLVQTTPPLAREPYTSHVRIPFIAQISAPTLVDCIMRVTNKALEGRH
jgi:hypothetical protein